MPADLPAVVTNIDLERVALGDPEATREAIRLLQAAINRLIVQQAQMKQKLDTL